MMLQRKQKQGVVRGCIIPILAFAGFIALCYVFCLVIYLLNSNVAGSVNSTGGSVLLLLGA